MTPNQLIREQIPTASTAQIDKGIKQLEAALAEYDEYKHCFISHTPAPTREEQDKNDFFHDFSFFIGCVYFNLWTTYTEDEKFCYYSHQYKMSSRNMGITSLKLIHGLLSEERTKR